MTNVEYKVEIMETSETLTAKDKIKYKKFNEAIVLDHILTADGDSVLIEPAKWVKVRVTSPKADAPYEKMIVEDAAGTKYTFSSETCMRDFMEIWEAMLEAGERWEVKFMKCASKNREGKCFITCTVD